MDIVHTLIWVGNYGYWVRCEGKKLGNIPIELFKAPKNIFLGEGGEYLNFN